MHSQINFVDSQTLTAKPEVTAGRILVSSQSLDWDGIYIEKGENEEFTPNDVTVQQHYFAMNVGAPLQWEWKDGRTFRTHRYNTGDIWVNPAGVPFSHRIQGYNQFVLLTLAPSKIVELLPEQPLIEKQVFRRQHQASDRQLQALMQALLVEAELGGPNGRLYADALSLALTTHFLNHYSLEQSLNSLHLRGFERQRFGLVIDYIEAHLAEDISLSDLAIQAGLSKFHFSRLFKTAIGATPHQYVLKRRIERSALLLKRGNCAIAQVAHQLRFTDQSHFTRVFKQVKGVTPKRFIQDSA